MSQQVDLLVYGFEPDAEEEQLLNRLPVASRRVLTSFPGAGELFSRNDNLMVALLHDAHRKLAGQRRFSPVNYSLPVASSDGERIIVLFDDPHVRGGVVQQTVVWAQKFLAGKTDARGLVGYQHPSGKVTELPWGTAKGKTPARKAKAPGSGWSVATATAASVSEPKVVVLTPAMLEKEAALVALLGAFNFEVALSLEPAQLHQVYTQLVKRLALVAETAAAGGGEHLFHLVARLSAESLRRPKLEVMPEFEAVLLFGRPLVQLDEAQRKMAAEAQISDEQSHFSRIMDVDDLAGVKRQVGMADAGDPRIARMLMNVARLREDLGVVVYPPLPHQALVETANFRNPKAPFITRTRYPYLTCVISAGTGGLARDLMKIFGKLIVHYPLDIVFVMMEEWLMRNGVADSEVSFTAAQLVRKSDREYEARLVGVGGGAAVIRSGDSSLTYRFATRGQEYGEGELAVGRPDFQQPYLRWMVSVQPGDEVFVFPVARDLEGVEPKKLNRAQEASFMVSATKHKIQRTFAWTDAYVQEHLATLVEEIARIAPDRVTIQFGHVHGDREPGQDQVVGAQITRALARALQSRGISGLEFHPLSDNYHVIDRLDFRKWIALLEEHSGFKVTEVQFEDALISRCLGDALIARIYRRHPELLVHQGGNHYLRPAGREDMLVELYDGVPRPEIKGRQGCVPFQLGFELYRLNPDWMNAAYRRYIMQMYPESLVAAWWADWPEATYQQLMLKHVYLLPSAQRMELKARVDEEIDRPYGAKCASGQALFLEDLLAAAATEKVVLLHVLEGFYDGQERKSTAMWQACEMPKVHQWRVSFNRHTGELQALDWNRHLR